MSDKIMGTMSDAEQWEAFARELRLEADNTGSVVMWRTLQRSANAAERVAARIRQPHPPAPAKCGTCGFPYSHGCAECEKRNGRAGT